MNVFTEEFHFLEINLRYIIIDIKYVYIIYTNIYIHTHIQALFKTKTLESSKCLNFFYYSYDE